jgi:UDP-N-acetylmuramate--alanine ligase
LGSNSSIEDKLIKPSGLEHTKIQCGKFRRDYSISSIAKNIIGVFLTAIGFFQSLGAIIDFHPDLIFSKSSYLAVPVSLAARVLKIPFVIHESDVVPGLATRLCSRYAHAVLTAFPVGIFPLPIKKKAIYTGLPIRKEFNRDSLSDDYILITGGSQGSLEINHRFEEVIPELSKRHRIIHLTGENDFKRMKMVREKLDKSIQDKYEIKAYASNMPELMKKAKLVISRSGATTIFEISALGKKAIFIPITSGVAAHQIENALLLKNLNIAELILPEDGPSQILKKINALIDEKTSPAIRGIYFDKSSSYIAKLLNEFIDFYSFKKIKNVFLIGAGGVSMKGIANLLTQMGMRVKGSDLKTGGHDPKNINLSYDLVVYSSAADKDSEARGEHERAEQLKIDKIRRSELIGILMKGYRGISVSGMHGKTSVSMLIARLLENAGFDPSYLIGAPSSEANRSSNLGIGIDFVSEACEYDGSFLDFTTKIAILTNIEEEHLDYFKKGLKQIIDTFSKFLLTIEPGGLLIYSADDENIKKVIKLSRSALIAKNINLISYGFSSESDLKITDYKVEKGLSTFSINGFEFRSEKIGEFFALNSAAMYALSKYLGINDGIASQTVSQYRGAARRFEYIGENKGVRVYDDYGHHPTEVKVTLQALSEKFPTKRKFVIFEPHQQKRFNDFFEDFYKVFAESKIDVIGILPVYKVPGRDVKEERSVEDLVKKINSPKVISLDDYEQALNFLEENLKNGDILITMGATDIYKVARDYLKS